MARGEMRGIDGTNLLLRKPMLRAREEPAFVLSTQPWKETSLIAELLTKHHGRVTVVVRGAKRLSSRFRGLINPFVPLMTSFSGTSDIKNLTDARWLGGLAPIEPEALATAFYVNELVLRMTVRNDECSALFAPYTRVLADLSLLKGRELSLCLRAFELRLLEHQGWGQKGKLQEAGEGSLWTVRDGELVRVNALQAGQTPVTEASARAVIGAQMDLSNDLREIRDVLRRIIGYYVGVSGFKTRRTLEHWTQF